MSLQDQIKSDIDSVFLNTSDFANSIVYTPQGGSPRTIKGYLGDPVHAHFREGNQVMRWTKRNLTISGVDDVKGVTVPKVLSRDGIGDSCVINGLTWYVVDIEREGYSGSNTFMHTLLLSDKKIGVTEGN